MKTKITILLIALFVLAFSAQAFSQTKSTPFTAVTLDLNSDGDVDAIDVNITDNIVEGSTDWTQPDLWASFTVGGFSSAIVVEGVNSGGILGDNIFRVLIQSAITIPTSIETLVIEYIYNASYPIITTDPVGHLVTFNYLPVQDGAPPVITAFTAVTDHVSGILVIGGSLIDITFQTNEQLLNFPNVSLLVGTTVITLPQDAVQNGDRFNWKIDDISIPSPAQSGINGSITLKIEVEDFNYNETYREKTSDLIYKGDDPTTTYVDDDWDGQGDVDPPTLIWQWDAFKTVQDGIDGLADTGTLIVNVYAGTYAEDLVIDKTLELKPYGTAKAYDAVTIKGVSVVDQYAKVITIEAADVVVHDFTIETADAAIGGIETVYGISVENTGAVIYNNTIRAENVGNATGDQGLVTLLVTASSGVNFDPNNDVGGLHIYNNDFTTSVGYESIYPDVEGIYVNYNSIFELSDAAIGNVTIDDNEVVDNGNTFTSLLWRSICTERGNTLIEGNTISSTLTPGEALAYRGIDVCSPGANLNPGQDNVDIIDNHVSGYLWGISLSTTSATQHLTNVSVTGNTITANTIGVKVRADADEIVVNYNSISGNTSFGIQNDDAVTKASAALDATNNWWDDETGPYNLTYNPQGGGGAVSDYVLFSHWWTDAGMTILGSSEIAINQVIDVSSTEIIDPVSNTDGTISFWLVTTYADSFDINLPHVFNNNALLEVDVAFNAGARMDMYAWDMSFLNCDIGGVTESWLSDLIGLKGLWDQPDGPPYPDYDSIYVVLKDLDDVERTLTIQDVGAETFTTDVFGNYYDDNPTKAADFPCNYNNSYRGFSPYDGFILGKDSTTLQDPMQYAIDNITFQINDDLACNVEDVLSFSVTTTYPAAPTTPALSADWLTDAYLSVTAPTKAAKTLPAGTVIHLVEWDRTLVLTSPTSTLWLSEIVGEAIGNYDHRNPLVNEPWGSSQIITVQLSKLDHEDYNLEITSLTAAAGNFVAPSKMSQTQYVLGQDDINFQDPIQYAIDNTTLSNSGLEHTIQDLVNFDIEVNYPAEWSDNPELPDELLVDALITTTPALPVGVEVTASYNDDPVGSWTADGTAQQWLSVALTGSTPNRPMLKDDGSGTWNISISGLDGTEYAMNFKSIASDDFSIPADNGYYELGETTVTFTNPIQWAAENVDFYINDDLAVNTADVLSFSVNTDYPAAITTLPNYSADWLTDAYILATDPTTGDPKALPAGAVAAITNWGGFQITLANPTSTLWLSEIVSGVIGDNSHRNPLQNENWGGDQTIYIELTNLDYKDYNLEITSVVAGAANFGAPSTNPPYQVVLDAPDEMVIQDPIQYAIKNTTLAIGAITPPTAKGALKFTMTVDYPVFPSNPVLPVAPENILNVDCLIGANRDLPATTNIELSYNGALLGDWTIGSSTDEIWLSEIITGINHALPIRTPLIGHSGLTDEWLIELTGLDYYAYELTFTDVASNNFTPPGKDLTNGYYELAQTTADFTIPYFTTLEIKVKDGASGTWGDPVSQDDDTPNVLNAVIDLDVFEPDYFYVNLKNTTATNVELQEGYHAFYIDTAQYPAPHALGYKVTKALSSDDYTFLEYWASRGVYDECTGTWEPIMWQIVDGKQPFFYIKVTDTPGKGLIGQTYELIDGLIYQLYTTDENMRINGDYFLGDYVFTGYVYSAAHDVESNGVAALKSDLITINISLEDNIETTYPDFTVLDLQDQVQGTDHWIELKNPVTKITESYVMFLNDLIEYYDINIKNLTTTKNYSFAPAYQPFYLDTSVLPASFYTWWGNEGVSATTGPVLLWNIINGDAPIFYVLVNDDQTMQLVDGYLYASSDTDPYVQIDGDYPLGDYRFVGELVGINGTMSTAETVINMEFQEALAIGFAVTVDPVSPFVDTFFDIFVDALDVNDEIVDTSTTVFFSSNYAGATQLPSLLHLLNGELDVTDGGMCSEIVTDLQITVSEFNPFTLTGTSDDIVIQAKNDPAAPTGVVFADNPGDNGGWIYLTYTLSVDDPFYTAIKDPSYGVSYYVVEIDTVVSVGGSPDWHYLADLECYDNGTGTNNYTALLPAPASDTEYSFRMAAVYNPTKLGGFDENHISYTEIVTKDKDAGAQSAWQTGSAAPKDNLPAYANITVFLEGPYQTGGTMDIDGMILQTISPYDLVDIGTLPTIAGRTLIDWIYVELRNTETGSTIKETNAFVLDNGMIVDTEGNYSLPFYYTTAINYYLVIHHRNHLDIMSADTYTFGDFASDPTPINLSLVNSAYLNGFKEVETGIYAMYSGDGNDTEVVNPSDAMSIVNNWLSTEYNTGDLNLSGLTNATDAIEIAKNNAKMSKVPIQAKNANGNGSSAVNEKLIKTDNPTGSKDGEDCTLEIKNVQVHGNTSYSFDVYIQRNAPWDTNTALGTLFGAFNSTLVFDVTDNAFSNPVSSNWADCINGTINTLIDGKLLQIELITSGTTVGTTSYRLLTMTLDIENPYTTAGLYWNSPNCLIVKSDNWSEATTDLIGEDNSTLPVDLSTFTAQYLDKIPVLYWETESETDNMGWFVYRNNEDDFTNAYKVSEFLEGHGTTSEKNSYTHEDTIEDPKSGDVYYYWLESIDYGGIVHHYDKAAILTIPDLVEPGSGQIARPEIFGLLQNAPNPFVNGTSIVFNLHQTAQVELKIYNIKGELVKDLYSGISDYKSLQWNGTDDTGKQLSPGIYLYNLTVNGKSQEIKKLILMR